jgi:hypothetical protein
MRAVADAFLRTGLEDAQIRRRYVQALIEDGKLYGATTYVNMLLHTLTPDDAEWSEAKGLLGRIYKQEYVNSRGKRTGKLTEAIEQYSDAYEKDPVWHGINQVALLARAERDGVPAKDFRPLAQQLLALLKKALDNPGGASSWERATLVEIHVALGDYDAAFAWAERYVQADGVEAFHIGSLRRQLNEVWGITSDSEPGGRLLAVLDAELLYKGGDVSLSSEEVVHGLEADFGGGFVRYGWYDAGLKRCKSVARIETLNGDGLGTGFLIDGDFFYAGWQDRPLLLTNAHVISEGGQYRLSIRPEAAMAFFSVSSKRYSCAALHDSSPPDELDFSIVELKELDPKSSCCPTTPPAATFDRNLEQRLFVIGHPNSGDLAFSLRDSVWLDEDHRYMHYRTPTAKGSSGSPVFDDTNWVVVGLHHKGKEKMPKLRGQTGVYEANEAVRLTAIQEYVRQRAALSARGGS